MRIFILLVLLESVASAGIDEPSGCWRRGQMPCAFQAEKNEWLEVTGGKFLIEAGAALVREKADRFQLLHGNLWVEAEKQITFRQSGCQFHLGGEVWLVKGKEKLQARQFLGESRIEGAFESEVLPAGFENWWELRLQGTMIPFALKPTLQEWNRFVRFDKKGAAVRVASYRKAWQDRFDLSEEFYRSLTQRRLASVEEVESNQRERQQSTLKEQKALRDLFRQRQLSH